MQVYSALGTPCRGGVHLPVPLFPTQRLKPALFTRLRRLGTCINALNEFHEAEGAAVVEAFQETRKSKEKDPSRFVADTSDEEANLPENPIDLDEEIIIPHRPSISDLYKDVRHEWKDPDLSKTGKVVADTSDEESNLPSDPLDLDEEMMIPQKQMVKEIYKNLPKKEGQEHEDVEKTPGSHEMPNVEEPKHGQREENMIDVEKDVTKMESKQGRVESHPRSVSELPGLVNQDTTLINPGSSPIEFHESGIAENEERIQGIYEAMDKIADDKQQHHSHQIVEDEKKQEQQPSTADALSPPPPHSEELRHAVEENPSTEASYTGLEGGINDQMDPLLDPNANDQMEEETYEINFSSDDDQIMLNTSGGAGGEDASNAPLGRLDFSFKAEDKEENQNKTSPERLQDAASKAAAAGGELDPLTKLTDARQAYREHRMLTEEALRQIKPSVTLARIIEVAAGRAAVVGFFSTMASEVLLGQSVLSQLLGRWEGFTKVEGVVSQSRTLALAVIALSLGISATEALFTSMPPPARKYFGFTPNQQIWVGRIAMGVFLGIVLYETMHSNRPLFPFWYLLH